MRFKRYAMVCTAIFTLMGTALMAQQTEQEKHDAIVSLITSKDFSFIAQSATTMKGNTIELSSGYGIKLMTDSISVDMPFFGDGYDANFGATDNGIKLDTKEYTYKADSTKKGSWNINITPTGRNVKVSRINLNITPAGYCTVRVSSINQQPMSYYGRIADNLTSH